MLLLRRLLLIALGILSVVAIALIVNRVDDLPTAQDSAFIAGYLQSERIAGLTDSADYAAQLAFIRRVQVAVLDSTPTFTAIPMRHAREPRDVILAQHGVCHDRSRVIEKILRWIQYETRLHTVGREPIAAGSPASAKSSFTRGDRSAYSEGVAGSGLQRSLDIH